MHELEKSEWVLKISLRLLYIGSQAIKHNFLLQFSTSSGPNTGSFDSRTIVQTVRWLLVVRLLY
jgi:hypothetical protein